MMNTYQFNRVIASFILLLLISVYSCAPTAQFSISTSSQIEAPAIVSFGNLSKNATYYHWDFGDGTSTVDANPTHKYILSGQYQVVLTAIKGEKKITSRRTLFVSAPTACRVVMLTTLGEVELELYDQTPAHRDNFIKLVENGYYDDLLFHRVIKGFMIQGGDPDSRHAGSTKRIGGGGPGYTIPAEIHDTLVHTRGAMCAARTGDDTNPLKASSGSQFYIVDGRNQSITQLEDYALQKNINYTPYAIQQYLNIGGSPQLDKEYTVFGKVIRGIEVINAITNQKMDENDRPLQDVKIINVALVR
jgi:cyclophilin family peptidyl-prolyl cis-trans isomerase